MALNARVQQLYREASQFPQGGVLVGAGRSGGRMVKGLRHCVSSSAGPSGKKRCMKYSSGPAGSGKYRSCDVISARGPSGKERCVRYVRHGAPHMSPAQRDWQARLRAYRAQTGATLKQAMEALATH